MDLPKGATEKTLAERLGPLQDSLGEIEGLEEGVGKTPTAVTFSPAMIAAKSMEKQIMDQLQESGASKQLRSTAFEMALFGTGVMKGPFAVDKEYPNWDDEGNIVLYLRLYHLHHTYQYGTFFLTLMLLIWMKHSM